jgi:hypothetical protein
MILSSAFFLLFLPAVVLAQDDASVEAQGEEIRDVSRSFESATREETAERFCETELIQISRYSWPSE